jgi:hypothetical protein
MFSCTHITGEMLMFQTVLMFLASPGNAARPEIQVCRPASRMATRARPAVAPGHAGARAKDWNAARNEALDQDLNEVPGEVRGEGQVTWLTVVGNALGFSLLMTGLWLVVRLVDTLLG